MVAIADTDGQPLVKRRLLPSGIMPYGEEGVRLLDRWDRPYQDRRPGWDTGRVAPELKKAVEDEGMAPGRAVVLGCGTGTNAIYLATKGFEATGVDVAPAALTWAEEKAIEADVDVQWIVADVLALPELEPADLIFDRGCYHHVRQYNAAGYVESVRRLSRPGTRILLLAGSANEERRGGPPKIKEEEIRNDFSALFDFEWFREIRFDSRNPNAQGPLAWSVLMRRKDGD
jgi:SAM-dependent methyltransferase